MAGFNPVASAPVGATSTTTASTNLVVSEQSAYVILTNVPGIVLTEQSAYVVLVPSTARGRRQALLGAT